MKSKKIWGAALAGLSVILYYGILLWIVISADIQADDKMPISIFIIVVGAFLIPIIGVLIAFLIRLQEIKSGEEEEAKKY